MTTQTTTVTLFGGSRSIRMTKTSTDGQWNELLDATNSKSLGDVMKGQTIKSFLGQFAAGNAFFRVRDSGGGKAKFIGHLNPITEERVYRCRSFTIGPDDILEVHCVAVPT